MVMNSLMVILMNQTKKSDIIYLESEEMKMPKFNIEISDSAYYPDIEAESEEAAMYMAVGWWMERNPDIHCEEAQEDA